MPLKDEILEHLKNMDNYVSGEQLSAQFGVTRTAIWKNINLLRKQGYQIESVTNRGYRLAACSDALTEESISTGLTAKRLGSRVFCYETIHSTNEAAKHEAQNGAPDGSVFVAECQQSGKGRLGRAWASPAGTGLWFSVLLRHGFSLENVSTITLLAGLAVCRVIRAETGCDAKIKWPNDIVVGNKKVCGILTEMAAAMEGIEYVVLGIGINVNMDAFPEELAQKATSLKLEYGKTIARVPFLQKLLLELEALLQLFEQKGISPILLEYRTLCVSLNRKVQFTREGQTKYGIAKDVTEQGELTVEEQDGTHYQINSGEVSVQGIYDQSF